MEKPVRLMVLAALLLGGCASYTEGERRTVGEFTDDTAIQTSVKLRLVSDRIIKGLKINTEVKRGVVTLIGTVPTEEVRRKAVGIAERVKGVKRVDDQLYVIETGAGGTAGGP